MITKIKALADEAIKLQNKNRMDEVLREISAMCEVKEREPEKSEEKITEKKRKVAKDV